MAELPNDEVAWVGAHAFHEYAEALGVETTEVCAVWRRPDGTLQGLFNREQEATPDSPLVEATFERDEDGILRVVREETTDLTVRLILKRATE